MDLSENVNVIFGHNEAGKSRVRDFIEWFMFAGSNEIAELKNAATKKAFAHLDPFISGSAQLCVDGQSLSISQKLVEGITQSQINSSTISPADVSRVLTDGLTRSHYNNIFSLTLDELTSIESNKLITENELMNMFFGAAISGSGISPPKLLSELTKQRDEMFSVAKQTKNRSINRVLKEIADVNKDLKQFRLDDKAFDSIDVETQQMTEQIDDIDAKLESLSLSIENIKNILDNDEIFGEYLQLCEKPKPVINSALISREMEIKMLNQSAKELKDQGDERESARLTSVLDSLKANHAQQEIELSSIVPPSKIDESACSTKFEALILNEERERTTHIAEIKSIQNGVAKYSADLAQVTKEIERLNTSLADLEGKEPVAQPSTFVPTKAQRFSYSSTASLVSATGFLAGVLSLVFSQPIGIIFGFVVFMSGIAFQLMPKEQKQAVQTVQPQQNNILLQQISSEIEKNHAQMTDFHKRIENLLDDQKQLESTRSIERKKFEDEIINVGFSATDSPHDITLYINAFRQYRNDAQQILQTQALIDAANKRLTSVFEKAESMKDLAKSTRCEISETFESLDQIITWSNSLHELAKAEAQAEKVMFATEAQLRNIEKQLTSVFTSVEQAKELYTNANINELKERYAELIKEKDELKESRTEIDHEIVRRQTQRNAASKSTDIADASAHLIRLTEELKTLHEQYKALFVAHDVVAKSLETFMQENQPELLRVASKMMNSITNGQWSQISLSQSESSKNSEPIITINGLRAPHGLSISQLSRGTREQLYLCLRLALMETSMRGKHIPALFDDIAVNSDRSRFEALAPQIGRIGQHRQVIYFTCHEITRDILADHAGARIISI